MIKLKKRRIYYFDQAMKTKRRNERSKQKVEMKGRIEVLRCAQQREGERERPQGSEKVGLSKEKVSKEKERGW